jgi:hypothetical protein
MSISIMHFFPLTEIMQHHKMREWTINLFLQKSRRNMNIFNIQNVKQQIPIKLSF